MSDTPLIPASFVARTAKEMPGLVAAKDWAKTQLGPQDRWSPSLRLAVDMVLSSGFPMALRWGPDFVLIYNDEYRPILGDKHPWALGLPAREAWSEVWPQLEPLHRRLISGQSPAVFAEDVLLRIKRYKDCWEDAHFTLSYGPAPDPTSESGVGGILVTAIETTQRIEAERQVREGQAALQAANATLAAERERFAQLFEQAPTFMAMLSGPDHVFTLANPGYIRLIGGRDIVGRTVSEALPDAVEQGYLELLDRVYRTGEPYVASGARYVFQLNPEDPVTERYLDFVYQPVRDADGAVTGIFVEGADVSDRARADAALRELNATLEAQVFERTEALRANEEALRQSQKMEAVGQLTGGIAHDFNNLLAAMSGSLELLEKRIAEGQLAGIERYIATARQATQRAASLTQRLLAFSRRQTLDPKPVDLNRLIGGMADLIKRTVGPAVQVEVVGAAGLWATKLDPGQMENALLNLCLNARDAMAPLGGRITIETANKWLDERSAGERDLEPGQYVSVCVTDTGPGMSDDVAAKAFDPFFTTKPWGRAQVWACRWSMASCASRAGRCGSTRRSARARRCACICPGTWALPIPRTPSTAGRSTPGPEKPSSSSTMSPPCGR